MKKKKNFNIRDILELIVIIVFIILCLSFLVWYGFEFAKYADKPITEVPFWLVNLRSK